MSMFEKMKNELGTIDILINNAGLQQDAPFDELTLDQWNRVINLDLNAVFYCCKAVVPTMIDQNYGRIVNIASIAGLTGTFGYTPYSGSKYALVGLTESLRYELKPRGVTVQLVCPGEFDTPMVHGAQDSRSPENIAHVQTIPPLTVEVVAADTLKGIESGRFMIVPGRIARIMTTFIRHFAGASRWLGDRIIAKSRVKEDT